MDNHNHRQYWNLSDFDDETGPGAHSKVSHTTKENSTIDDSNHIWRGWLWVTEVTEKPSRILWVEVDNSGIIIKENSITDEIKYNLEYNTLKVMC